MAGKLIIISAPSGCGKSTIIGDIMDRGELDVEFSVSATNRKPRAGEVDGVNYHFLSDQQFSDLIAEGAFVEYEQVYPGRYYGTLRSEIENRVAPNPRGALSSAAATARRPSTNGSDARNMNFPSLPAMTTWSPMTSFPALSPKSRR